MNKTVKTLLWAILHGGVLFLCLSTLCVEARAGGTKRELPIQAGFSVGLGHIYNPDPERGQFVMATGLLLLDHEIFPPFPASDAFRFKLEATLGKGSDVSPGFMVSGNFLTLYYVDALATNALRPYVEAGVGLIAVEEKWAGQGTTLNFNPLAGIGVEFAPHGDQRRYFFSGRLLHVSNGGLHKDNRGLDAFVFSTGVIF